MLVSGEGGGYDESYLREHWTKNYGARTGYEGKPVDRGSFIRFFKVCK